MATVTNKPRNISLDHLSKHRPNLTQQLDQIRQELDEQKKDPLKHFFIEQINQWEKDSIKKILKTAQQCRTEWINYSHQYRFKLKKKFNDLTKDFHQENQSNETDFDHLKEKLTNLQKELHRPTNVSLRQQSSSFINSISLLLPFGKDTRWKQYATTIAGGNSQGNQLDQLNCPHEICLDHRDSLIYIVDCGNARIVEWRLNDKSGRIVAGGHGQGNRLDQLNNPTDVIIDRQRNALIIADQGNRRVIQWSRQPDSPAEILISDIDCARLAMHEDGTLYVSDWKQNEVKRWKNGEEEGTIVAGGNGQGTELNQLHYPTSIFVTDDYTLYISDRDNHRIMKWMKDAKEGIVVAGGNGQGNRMTQLSYPQGVIVDQFDNVYVTDRGNDRVIRWCEGAKEGSTVIGGHGKGAQGNQLNYPDGLSTDSEGNLFVTDRWNYRIQKFDRELFDQF